MFQTRQRCFSILCGLILAGIWFFGPLNSYDIASASRVFVQQSSCPKLGWFPTDFGLKDHTVFWYDGYYYIASIYLPGEQRFAYGRSTDLCNWETLSPILTSRTPGAWDEMSIWAPSVYQEGGVYYMFYTGVNTKYTQSILLATSTNPADPASWQPQGMIFQPDHIGMNWLNGTWSDCRDPHVIKAGDVYYLYYTGSDISGGIIGLARSSSLLGPWSDWGAILRSPSQSGVMYESPSVTIHNDYYYLAYSNTSQGEYYQIGISPGGPWAEPYPLNPGWAHEIWIGQDGQTYTSYLTNYSITISPITWDTYFDPAHILIGSGAFHLILPIAWNQN